MLRKIGMVAFGTVVAGAATAQSMPAGFYIEGNAEYSNLSASDDSLNTSVVDLTFGYDGAQAGSAPFGVELNVFYIDFDGDGPDPSLSGIVYYDSSFGRFSVGMPATALDGYINAPVIGRSAALGFGEIGALSGSYIGLIARFDDINLYGVRFDGSFGDVKYGLSYHTLEDSDGFYAITGGAQYQFNANIVAAAGFEHVNDAGGNTETGYFGTVTADYGQFGGSILVSQPFIVDDTVFEIEANYRPIDDVEIYLGYATASAGVDFEISYIGAEYTFLDYGYVGASYMDLGSAGFGPSNTTNIYVGYNFMFGQR